MTAAAGFKLRAINMTALVVQVVGTILNKYVFTGEDLWGLSSLLASRFTEWETSELGIYVTLFLLVS